jgi:hypothetical protein
MIVAPQDDLWLNPHQNNQRHFVNDVMDPDEISGQNAALQQPEDLGDHSSSSIIMIHSK